MKVKPDKEHDPIPVKVKGEGSIGAKVTAIASGSLYAEGALKFDPKTKAIELPKTSAYEGTATISVIATSADGTQTDKKSFKVSVDDNIKDKEDHSGVIILTGAASRSDGTAWARIFNNANLQRYTIEATPTGVSVLKEYKRAISSPGRKISITTSRRVYSASPTRRAGPIAPSG